MSICPRITARLGLLGAVSAAAILSLATTSVRAATPQSPEYCAETTMGLGTELQLRYYGATWCAPCHRVGPMIDRWVAEHPDLRIVKLDYDTHKGDRERFGLLGVPMLVLLDGDKVIAKYGQNAQKGADFASDRLEWWFESTLESTRGKIDPRSQ
jgi:thiol-disulfide isomerase/thioredoxin